MKRIYTCIFILIFVLVSNGKEFKGTGFAFLNENMTLEQAKKLAYNNAIKNAVESFSYIEYQSEYSTTESENQFKDNFTDLIKSNFEGVVKVVSSEYSKEVQDNFIKINCFIVLEIDENELKTIIQQKKLDKKQNNIDKINIDLEREKLQLEREKLQLEREKLELEKNKNISTKNIYDNDKDKYIDDNKKVFSEELKRPNIDAKVNKENQEINSTPKESFLVSNKIGFSLGTETLGFKDDDSRIFSLGLNFELFYSFMFRNNNNFRLTPKLGMTYFLKRTNIKINKMLDDDDDDDHIMLSKDDIKGMVSRFFYVGLDLSYKSFYLGLDLGFFNNSILYDNIKFSIRPKIGFDFWYFETGLNYLFIFYNKDNLYMYPNLYLKLKIPVYTFEN